MTSLEQLTQNDKKPSHATQYFAAFSASMGAMAVGAAMGYSSPASQAFLRNNTRATWENETSNGDLSLTKAENDWFAGSLSIGAVLGCIMGGITINSLGRRGTMLAASVPLMVGWLLIGFAQNLAMLIIGRILCGLCTGLCSLVVPMYTTEYASTDIRGALGSGFQLFLMIGIEFAYIFGAVIPSWRWLTAVCAVLGIVFVALVAFIKESPLYLLSKGREAEAREAMQYFRGDHYNIESEIQTLQQSLKELKDQKISFQDLMAPFILKPFLITLGLMLFQQMSGSNAFLFNISIIFEDSGTSVSEDVSAITVGLVQVLVTAASSLLLDRTGRKLFLILSAAFMCLSVAALGAFFYIKNIDEEGALTSLNWLPLSSLMVFVSAFSIGYGPIPWLMMGELFSPNVKEAAGSAVATFNWTCVFVVTFTFGPMQEAFHDYGAYWFFAGVCALNVVFCIFLVPETKGKTLQEITTYFGGPSSSSSSPSSSSSSSS